MTIDSIHLATVPGVETGAVAFDRAAEPVILDEDLHYRIYSLERPLQPGDSLRLDFEVHIEPRGFRESEVDASVVANGTYFTNRDWLPAIGYQRGREFTSARDRRAHGLAPRPLIPSLHDVEARMSWAERIAFEAVVGTGADQIAVAPGALRRTWTEGGRRYYHYSTDAPIGNEYALFSADYTVQKGRWNDVAIQIFHHPGHDANLDLIVRSVRASLDYYTQSFGPYRYSHLTLVERPGHGTGMHADASMITYEEGFSLWNPEDDPGSLDLPFAVVAHEVAHPWTVPYAYVEGAPMLSESLAWYSAMQVVEETHGREHLRRLLSFMRQPSPYPPIRRGEPLLRALDPYLAYRKGPFALHALSEYMGTERVNTTLRRLVEKHRPGEPPLATTLDLYGELQAVTPDSLQPLLHDLFEVNTFWEFDTERATSEQTEAGTWQVTFDLRARKVVFDSAGVETEVPMDDWVQIGVFAPAEAGEVLGDLIYLQMHRIRSAEQTITVTVPRKPARAGIDPYNLLDWERGDNIEGVKIES
ncbi:MAG: M1 family metallopeptidase [Chloroflexota bacterium]